jgi:hypothetical protein
MKTKKEITAKKAELDARYRKFTELENRLRTMVTPEVFETEIDPLDSSASCDDLDFSDPTKFDLSIALNIIEAKHEAYDNYCNLILKYGFGSTLTHDAFVALRKAELEIQRLRDSFFMLTQSGRGTKEWSVIRQSISFPPMKTMVLE